MSDSPTGNTTCVMCGRTSDAAPLLDFTYQGQTWHICSQHLPVLIHDPGALAGRLPGAGTIPPAHHNE